MKLPRLHLVTDDRVLARSDFVDVVSALGDALGPAAALHLRGPAADGRSLIEVGRRVADHLDATGTALVVNDRADVGLVLAADGVHLGARSLDPARARDLVPEGRWIGRSVHAGDARGSVIGADYLFVGNVFATGSHPGRSGLGIAGAAEVAARCDARLPWLGIGGITPDRVGAVRAAGAHGVAVLGGVWDDADPVRAAGRYLSALGETAG